MKKKYRRKKRRGNILLYISLFAVLSVGYVMSDGEMMPGEMYVADEVQQSGEGEIFGEAQQSDGGETFDEAQQSDGGETFGEVQLPGGLTATDGIQISDEAQTSDVGSGPEKAPEQNTVIHLTDLPEYAGEPYVIINGNVPGFQESEYTTESFERYSELDELGRCGVAYANIGKDIMPTEERGNIGHIKPSGWQFAKYDCVDGKYLYNRCHLIAFQLAGENANEKNLITGTRYMNVDGMLPFENQVADYVKETGNHVLYRVTPIYKDENLVASGVQMEALSVEDNGEGICFHVYVYNVQPGVVIDYATGESRLEE